MATAYTTLLGLALPVTGELNGTWGDVVNNSITELVEDSIAGSATASVTSGDWTLTTTGSGAANQARSAILIPTGTPGVSRNIIAPSSSKAYIVDNQSNAAVVVKGSATTGVSIATNTAALVAWDGTDFVLVAQDLANASGTLPVTKGGTGATTLTANNVILGNGTSAVQVVAPGTTGNVLTSNGTTWASTALPNVGDVDGPGSSTDNAIARFDGTTGKIIQNSAVTIADDGATVIDANSTSAALRITQVGSGNALLVEDSANPDATPFVIDASGNVLSGKTSSQAVGSATPQFQLHSLTASPIWDSYANFNWSASNQGAGLVLAKSRSGVIGTFGSVAANDNLGQISFYGDDSAAFIPGASITAAVDGTPGTNDMPGRLVFSTTADGASSPTERMRIDNAGRVGIGIAPGTDSVVRVGGGFSSTSTNLYVNKTLGTLPSNVTGSAHIYEANWQNAAASYTLSNLAHFAAVSSFAPGAGSTITNEYGFYTESNVNRATNNYGFYSNIGSGTGRWNFYAAGSANNYFAGNVGIGTTPGTQLDVSGAWFAGVGTMRINGASGQQYSGFTVANNGSVRTYFYDDNTNNYTFIGTTAGKALVFATNTGGTDGERMRIFASGGVSIGNTTDPGATNLSVTGTITAATFPSPQLTTAPYVNGSYRGNIVAVAALDIDCSAGNYFTKTINGASTFTFSNAPASRSYSFTLELTQTSGAVTWPAAVQWPGGTAPTLTAGKTHLFMFVTDDGGTRWRGAALVDYTN